MREHVVLELSNQGLTSVDSVVNNSCKSAISRTRLKKTTNILVVYLPRSLVQPFSLISDMTSDSRSIDSSNIEKQTNELYSSPKDCIPVTFSKLKFEYVDGKHPLMQASFDYLEQIFSLALSGSCISTKLSNVLDDILSYCFHNCQRLFVNVSALKQLLRRRISSIILRAKKKATAKHQRVIKVLAANDIFCFNCSTSIVESIKETDEFESSSFDTYFSIRSSDRVLLVRDSDVICILPKESSFDLTISKSFILKALKEFDVSGLVDIEEINMIVNAYFQERNLIPDIEQFHDNLKTVILENRSNTFISKFLTCGILIKRQEQSLDEEIKVDLDTILGRTYKTRGIKRRNHCVPVDSDSTEEVDSSNSELDEESSISSDCLSFSLTRNKRQQVDSSKENLIRDFLHIKDEYHITDSAIRAMHKFFHDSKQLFFSMAEIRKARKQANKHIPLKFTKDACYVPFDFALRVSVFVATKFRSEIRQLSKLVFRLNMDGTLMGNKHVVAISVNCVEGGPSCQSAKNLAPVGIFAIQKESNELLRKALPVEFLSSIQSTKQLRISKRKICRSKNPTWRRLSE